MEEKNFVSWFFLPGTTWAEGGPGIDGLKAACEHDAVIESADCQDKNGNGVWDVDEGIYIGLQGYPPGGNITRTWTNDLPTMTGLIPTMTGLILTATSLNLPLTGAAANSSTGAGRQLRANVAGTLAAAAIAGAVAIS